MNTFSTGAPNYVEAGYSPIPIRPGKKAPGFSVSDVPRDFPGWQRFCQEQPSAHELALWSVANVQAGIGLALGYNNVVAIDIDIPDGPIFDMLVEMLPSTEWAKIGSKGLTVFARTEEPIKPRKFKIHVDENWNPTPPEEGGSPRAVLEFLAFGNQTVIPPTIHPDTNQPYRWVNEPLSMCPAQNLPVLPASFLDDVKAALEPYGYIAKSENHVAGEWNTEHVPVYSDLNADALADLDCWVPLLDRADFDPEHKGPGYRMRATWRDGTNPNTIRIDNTMIFDYGEDKPIRPIDLVVYMNDLSPGDAFSWLFGKVNAALVEAFSPENVQRMLEKQEEKERLKGEAEQRNYEERVINHAAVREEEARLAAEETQRSVSAEETPDSVQEYIDAYRDRFGKGESLDNIIADCQGLMKDIIEYTISASKTPSVAIAAVSSLSMLSVLFGRRWASTRIGGGGETFANIYAFGTAPSGIGKTTSAELAHKIYYEAVDRVASSPAAGVYATATASFDEEGNEIDARPLISILRGVIYEKDVHAPATLQNQLISSPHTVMVVDEASNFVRRVWSEKGSDSSIGLQGAIKKLISAAGSISHGTDYTQSAKNQSAVHNPGFSFIGYSTQKALLKALPSAAYEDGTIGRFLWLDEPGFPDMVIPSANMVTRGRCVDQMTAIIASHLKSETDLTVGGYLAPDLPITPIIVPRTSEAQEMILKSELFFHEEARRAHKVDREDGALWSRVSECAQRIALLHALGRGIDSPVIEIADINFGLRLATYSLLRWASQADLAAGREVVGVVDNDRLTRRAIAALGKHGGQITRAKLARELGLPSKQVMDLVDSLYDMGYVDRVPGGRVDSIVIKLRVSPGYFEG